MTQRLVEMKKEKGPGAILTLPIAGQTTRTDRRKRRYIRGRWPA
jgi:ribosomal protein S13